MIMMVEFHLLGSVEEVGASDPWKVYYGQEEGEDICIQRLFSVLRIPIAVGGVSCNKDVDAGEIVWRHKQWLLKGNAQVAEDCGSAAATHG